MKTFTRSLFLLAAATFLLTSCNNDDEQWCGVTPSGTAVGSIEGAFHGNITMRIGESPVNYGVRCTMVLDSISANSVGALFDLYPLVSGNSEEIVGFESLLILIDEPVSVTGSPYDVRLEYEGSAVRREVNGEEVTETPLPGVSFKGWMKNEYFSDPATRCSIGLTFESELELRFTLGEKDYSVSIGPDIFW